MSETTSAPPIQTITELTAQIVSAHVSHNTVPANALPELIKTVFMSLSGASTATSVAVNGEPAVPIKTSVRADKITCLECGKTFSMLKRHLMSDHKMTTQDYRTKWQLGVSYPMVAPNYAKIRSGLAKKIGLGRKSGTTIAVKGTRRVVVKKGAKRKAA